jgi:hypothetical protein
MSSAVIELCMIVLLEVIVIVELVVLTLEHLLLVTRVVWLLLELICVGVDDSLNLSDHLSNLRNRDKFLI